VSLQNNIAIADLVGTAGELNSCYFNQNWQLTYPEDDF